MDGNTGELAHFALALLAARKAAGLSRQEVADRMGESSPQGIYNYEKGLRRPSTELAFQLERAVDARPGTLTRHLGFLPLECAGRPLPCTVVDAVDADRALTAVAKRQLLGVYREFVS